MFKAVVFDIGQTLVNYKNPMNWSKLYRPAFQYIADECGYHFSEAQYQHAGKVLSKYNTRINPREHEVSSAQIFREIIDGIGIPEEDIEQVKYHFFSFFRQDTSLFPEVEETLQALVDKGLMIATLSDVAYGMDNTYALEDIAEIKKYINYPFTSNDAGYRKPSTKGLEMLAEKMQIAISEMIFVGDEEKDIICANNAGAYSILINRDNAEKKYGQNKTIHSLTELLNIIGLPYQNVLDSFVTAAREIMGDQLTGIYLHGSLAMGCFHPQKSDIDLIIVIEENISDEQKMQFMESVIALNWQAPAKGLEMSIILRKYCNPFLYPTPFELHFSPIHLRWFCDKPQDYIKNMKGIDKDLAAHFTILRQYGITLFGENIKEVFAQVPRNDYVDSIWEDVKDAKEEILKQPMYIVLNLCRVLAFCSEGLYLSKREGAEWGMEHLSAEYSTIISSALRCYESNQEMILDEADARAFANEMLAAIKEKMKMIN